MSLTAKRGDSRCIGKTAILHRQREDPLNVEHKQYSGNKLNITCPSVVEMWNSEIIDGIGSTKKGEGSCKTINLVIVQKNSTNAVLLLTLSDQNYRFLKVVTIKKSNIFFVFNNSISHTKKNFKHFLSLNEKVKVMLGMNTI